MRPGIILLLLLLGTACSAKKPIEDGFVTKAGVIATKEVVDLDEVSKEDSKVKTSVFASFSTGGRTSIGLGFLFFPLNSNQPAPNPIRYRVNLLDGTEVTLYHKSDDFAIDDCVEITLHEDVEKHPPSMKRNKGGC